MIAFKLLTIFSLFQFVFSNDNFHNNGQLPQLINADGSLTSHSQQHLDTYGNYYQQHQQQPFQGATNFLSQAGNELKQTAHNMEDHLHNAGEALSNAPRNFVDGVGHMGHQISHGFENMVQNGMNKLNDLKSQFGEKFRPLLDNAMQIFNTPKSEKEHWNELVQRVESTNLSEQEKQQLYQRIADATAPQSHQQQGHQQSHQQAHH